MIDENIFELMKHSFGGAIHTVYVPSLKRSIPFKEPTVRETKLMSKIVISNPDSQSIVYATTLALIKGLCVESDFNQYAITEFDRLSILSKIFANNFLSKQISIKCTSKECGHQFVYTVKHGDLIRAIESIDTSDMVFVNETADFKLTAKINYPTTKHYLEFLEYIDRDSEVNVQKNNVKLSEDKYEKLNSAFSEIEQMQSSGSKGAADIGDIKIAEMLAKKKERIKHSNAVAGNMEINGLGNNYSLFDSGDLYIREISYKITGDDNDYNIVFDDSFGFEDRERVLGTFPMSFLTLSDETTLLDFAANGINDRLRKCIPEVKCPKCGNNIANNISISDFFTHG